MILDSDVWLDGRTVPAESATVSLMSHALHYSGAVYEGIRVYSGAPFELGRHIERLAESAAYLGFALPFEQRRVTAEILAYVRHANLSEAYIRCIAWRGAALGIGGDSAPIHLAIVGFGWPPPFTSRGGIDLVWSRWRRPAPDTAPVKAKCSTVYGIGTLASNEARDQGADDALFVTHDGRVADVTGANIFLVKGDTLITPLADTFLGGITRANILHGARGLGLRTDVRHVDPSEVTEADEAFVCGTAYEVVPVRTLGDHVFRGRDVGQLVQRWYLEKVHGR